MYICIDIKVTGNRANQKLKLKVGFYFLIKDQDGCHMDLPSWY